MKGIVRALYSFPSQIFHFLGVPFFFIVFVWFYRPFEFLDFIDFGRGAAELSTLIMMCIIFLVVLGFRLMLYFLRGKLNLSIWKYIGWCLAELLVMSAFCALFLSLMGSLGYFPTLLKTVYVLASILAYPYALLGLAFTVNALRSGEGQEDEAIVKFRDDSRKLRFAVAADSILYVQADENYAHVYYVDGEKIREQRIRHTMKALEQTLSAYGLVRCQRAYIVNPKHVKTLRKDEAGFVYADLDTRGTPAIPVSRTYYDRLSAIL